MAALFGRAKRDFLTALMPLRNGIPSHDTFSRVFRRLDPDPFRRGFIAFMRRFAEAGREEGVVALDGKTRRRSFDRAASASPLHLVSAWAVEQRLVLGQLAGGGRQVERDHGGAAAAGAQGQPGHPARRCEPLPRSHPLTVVLHTAQRHQRRRRSRPQRGAARGRQHGQTSRGTRSTTAGRDWPPCRHPQGHGPPRERRREDRRQDPLLPAQQGVRYAARFGALVRARWAIENGLPWGRDGVMDEDPARSGKGHGAENLALRRRLALNLARLEPSGGSRRGKLKRAGWDDAFLTRLLDQCASPQMR